jgi:signal transduction histidine kinase
MRPRDARLPLGAWLALGFALAVVAPALGAGATWWAVGDRQRSDVDRRVREAARLLELAAPRLDDPALQRSLAGRLARLGVEADVQSAPPKVVVERGVAVAKDALLAPMTPPGAFVTNGVVAALQAPAGKRTLASRYQAHALQGTAEGTLFVARPSAAARVAAAAIVGLLALALALVAGVVLLRRWVVRPLARLAADAQRIAGGELDVAPVSSRTREVAEVGDALRGMAGGLRDALAERQAAEEHRRFLVTAIAHDLRTPLFTLRGSLEAIELGIGHGDQLRRAQDKATVLDRLVGDLFTFSRLEYAGPDLEREALDAGRLARDAADTVDPRIAVVAPDGAVGLEGDRAALLRVLVNLLDNAARHARSRVELRVAADDEEVRFEVLDDGPGIDAGDLGQLFQPLFRADRTRNSATGGAGLGLAIVERLTAAHGGTVDAANLPEGGACFTVRYPLRGRGP